MFTGFSVCGFKSRLRTKLTFRSDPECPESLALCRAFLYLLFLRSLPFHTCCAVQRVASQPNGAVG